MKFDTSSFLIGFVAAIIIVLCYTIFFSKKSFYESVVFTDDMSMEEAQKLLESETERMKNEYQQKEKDGTVSEEEKKKYQDDLIKLSTDFSSFMNKKSIKVEETASPAPAPPQETSQTSTYQVEPYN